MGFFWVFKRFLESFLFCWEGNISEFSILASEAYFHQKFPTQARTSLGKKTPDDLAKGLSWKPHDDLWSCNFSFEWCPEISRKYCLTVRSCPVKYCNFAVDSADQYCALPEGPKPLLYEGGEGFPDDDWTQETGSFTSKGCFGCFFFLISPENPDIVHLC